MFAKSVTRWNAVDVLGHDSLLHRGLVVDTIQEGLYIDFGTTATAPLLFPYKAVYRDINRNPLQTIIKPLKSQDCISALYQVSSDQPWKWYEAKFTAAVSDKILLLDVLMEGVHVHALFDLDHVRHRNQPRVVVMPSDFIRDSIALPEQIVTAKNLFSLSHSLWTEQFPLTHLLGVNAGRLYYIHGGAADSMIQEPHRPFVIKCINEHVATASRGMKRPLACLGKKVEKTVERNSSILGLHQHLLIELFSVLEINQKSILRLACRRFYLAASASARNEAIIHRQSCPPGNLRLASCIYAAISTRPKYIILSSKSPVMQWAVSRNLFRSANELIIWLIRLAVATNFKIPHLILAGVCIDKPDELVDFSSMTLRSTWRSVCIQLVLKDVVLKDGLSYFALGTRGPYIFRPVQIASLSIGTEEECSFRNVFEQNCTLYCVEEEVQHRVGRWLQDVSVDPIENCRELILRVLRRLQPYDVRFGHKCTWKEVETANLALNVDTLRKTTLWALYALYKSMHDIDIAASLDLASDDTSTEDSSSDEGDTSSNEEYFFSEEEQL